MVYVILEGETWEEQKVRVAEMVSRDPLFERRVWLVAVFFEAQTSADSLDGGLGVTERCQPQPPCVLDMQLGD